VAARRVIRLILGGEDRSSFDLIARYLADNPELGIELVDVVRNPLMLQATVGDRRADVVVIESQMHGFGPRILASLRAASTARFIIVTDNEMLRTDPNVDGTLAPPLRDNVVPLMELIQRVAADGDGAERPTGLAPAARLAPVQATASLRPAPTPVVPSSSGVIALWGPSNGVGRQTIAANLEFALTYWGRRKAVCVDSRRPVVPFRDLLPHAVDRFPDKHLYSLALSTDTAQHEPKFNTDALRRNLLRLKHGGNEDEEQIAATFLLGPVTNAQAYEGVFQNHERMTPVLLETLRRYFEYIIVDVDSYLGELWTQTAIQQCNRLIVVTTPHRPYLKIIEQQLPWIEDELGVPRTNIDLVVNRDRGELNKEELMKRFHVGSVTALADDPDTLTRAVNDRRPPMIDPDHPNNQNSEWVQDFKGFVNLFQPVFKVVDDGRDDRGGGGKNPVPGAKKNKDGGILRKIWPFGGGDQSADADDE
jgi:septum formation inhibitor-activating ATPase MinD